MQKDKYYVPSNFLNSERYYQNKTTTDAGIFDIETYNLKKWFLDKDNVRYLINQLFTMYMKHNYVLDAKNIKLNHAYFEKKVPYWMNIFVKDRKIEFHTESPDVIREDYTVTTHEVKSFRYFIDALSRVNREFLKEYRYFVSYPKTPSIVSLEEFGIYHDSELPGLTGVPDFNPFRASCIVGTLNEFERTLTKKTLQDMVYLVDDTRNMDVWQPEKTIRINRNFRYNNQIPIWQNLSKRNYDRDGDGLEHSDPNRASLETPIRGYNMHEIYRNADSYKYNTKGKW